MHLEGFCHQSRVALAVLQISQEVARVELGDFFNVSKYDVPLAAQSLWNIKPAHFREIILKQNSSLNLQTFYLPLVQGRN